MDREQFVADIRDMLADRMTPREIAARAGMSFSRVMANARTGLRSELLDWRGAMIELVEGLRREGMTMREALEFIGVYPQTYTSWRKEAGWEFDSSPADDDDTVYSSNLDGFDADLQDMLCKPWRVTA